MKSLNDYSDKLVDKILVADSYGQIRRFLLTSIKSMKKHSIHGHLISRFIDKTINQLHRLSALDEDIKHKLNIKYAKSQLELIKRHRAEEKASHV